MSGFANFSPLSCHQLFNVPMLSGRMASFVISSAKRRSQLTSDLGNFFSLSCRQLLNEPMPFGGIDNH